MKKLKFESRFCKLCNQKTDHSEDRYKGRFRCLKCIEDVIKKSRISTEEFVKIYDDVIGSTTKGAQG